MATKSFLTQEQLEVAGGVLFAPKLPPDGDEGRDLGAGPREFSGWLSGRLLERLSRHPEWQAADPVLLGSWARGELSAKSDIDVLFCGSEASVRAVVQDFSRQGLKLRYRMPEDPDDWTKGVEPFDVLALFSARALTTHAQEKLSAQLPALRGSQFRRRLLKAMSLERKARAERYDSISNYLEPNLKYGPGGLRDLEQALVTRELFPERFVEAEHSLRVLQYYKNFFLWVRHRLHLSAGASDVLAAPEQRALSDWFGFADVKDFMREIQKGLSRVSFYADWTIAQAASSAAILSEIEAFAIDSVEDVFAAVDRGGDVGRRSLSGASILWQNHVRLASDRVFKDLAASDKNTRVRAHLFIGRQLALLLDPMRKEGAMLALFRSRLIDHCVPEFRRIVGYVQHDQYHRFTVDAHLLQVLRELKRVCQKPSRGGKLAPFIKALSAKEREILAMACLFHDLAKGSGGDHSQKGVELARLELARFGRPEKLIDEVCWIIEEHLALSAAAFRENPRSPRTWRALAEKGVKGDRIRLLTVFTVVDILGTNPEAWTPWKERLLFELAHQLERPEADAVIGLAEELKKAKFKHAESLLDQLDVFLIGSVSPRVLADDLRRLASRFARGGNLSEASQSQSQEHLRDDIFVRVFPVRRGGRQTWIRFHSHTDRPGLFLRFVKWLGSCGLSVRHASIHTSEHVGVYDWFEVKTTKTPQQILKLLRAAARAEDSVRPDSEARESEAKPGALVARFDAIELVSTGQEEWVVSFRGRDQVGALISAARALFEVGAQIRWAKVHTWGRQIDDVFGIAPLGETNEAPGLLPQRLMAQSLSRR